MRSIELIAEVSSNHGGNMALLEDFVARYADAGADWIKVQSYQVRHLRPNDPQAEWLARAELSDIQHEMFLSFCAHYQVKPLTTVFTIDRVPFLKRVGFQAIKIGSGEAGEIPLLDAAIESFTRVFVSEGIDTVTKWHSRKVDALRCVSRYPAPEWMCPHHVYVAGGGQVGWSDHAVGIDIAQREIAAGARVIEKHVSLDNQARPSRSWEATPDEFEELRAFADADPRQHVGRWQYHL